MSEYKELKDTETSWRSDGLYRSGTDHDEVLMIKDGKWAMSMDGGETISLSGKVVSGFSKGGWEKVQ